MISAQNAPVADFEPGADKEALLFLKESVAQQVALQSGVLQECPLHHHVFYDDRNPRPAFELLLERINESAPEMLTIHGDVHELIDILSEVIANASAYCLHCRYGKVANWEAARV